MSGSYIKKSLIRYYKYLFYKMYRWSMLVNKDPAGHEDHAVIILSGHMMFNLFTIFFFVVALVNKITGYSIWHVIFMPGIVPGIIVVVMALLFFKVNYELLNKIGYKNIINEFCGESNRQRIIGNVIVILYEVVTIMLLIGSVVLMKQAGVE